jgi:protocatechuate 3,4-dioxygenase alpha subunit
MDLVPTPSQTVGPFFHFALAAEKATGCLAGAGAKGERVRLEIRVVDGDGNPVSDSLIELWQADASGKYNHPEDSQPIDPDPAFRGFGRLATDENGACAFETVKPGRTPGWGAICQAPHIDVSIFARGMLKRLVTRIYFDQEPANADDPALALIPQDRRKTLMARHEQERPGLWKFEIRLCGERETVFFDV